MPRPSKYTSEVVARIIQAVEVGSTYELAAAYGGISYDTLRTWVKTKPEFSVSLKEAEGRAAVKWLAKIEQSASDGSWQAAAWKLERRYPASYGRTVQDINHGGQPDNPVPIVIVRKETE